MIDEDLAGSLIYAGSFKILWFVAYFKVKLKGRHSYFSAIRIDAAAAIFGLDDLIISYHLLEMSSSISYVWDF